MAAVDRKRSLDGDTAMADGLPPRKKLRISDLPIDANKRSVIDSLLHTFKKKGEFDALRKLVYAQFDSGDAKANLLSSLEQLVDRETDRNPSLLSKERRIAAPLVEGAAERSDIYKDALDSIDNLMDQLIASQGIQKMREIRAKDVGAEQAAMEERIGSKTDDEYARDAGIRREARAEVREKELEEKRKLDRERKELEAEKARRREEERETREKERRDREREREEEREKERKRERERREKEELEREEREERRRKEVRREREERERREYEYQKERRDRRERDRYRDRDDSIERSRDSRRAPVEGLIALKPEDIKVDDDIALQALLKEGEEIKKSRERPALERSESLEPPIRRPLPPSSIVPRDPVAARLAKLDTRLIHKSPTKLEIKLATPTTTMAKAVEAVVEPDAMDVDEPEKDGKADKAEKVDKEDAGRGRSRSRCPDRRSSRRPRSSHSRDRERSSRYDYDDRRSSRYEDKYRSRDDDYRRSSRYYDEDDRQALKDKQRIERERDAREYKRSHREESRHSRSVSKASTTHKSSRYRSPSESRHRERTPRRSYREASPRSRRQRSRSRSPKDIDRYVPSTSARAKPTHSSRDDYRERDYRSRESYGRDNRDRDDDRDARDRDDRRRGDIDRYMPGRSRAALDDRDRERDRDRDRDRGDRDRRRRDRSRTRSRSRGSRR